MTSTTESSTFQQISDGVNLAQVLSTLRRHWLPLLLAPLLVGGLTYAALSQQPPIYQAGTSLMSAAPDNSNSILSGASVTAPQLPQGAVAEVVHSRSTVKRIKTLLKRSPLSSELQSKIVTDLENELSSGSYKRLSVRARVDQNQRGVYDLQASAETPEAARVLASAATEALVDWDLQRAREGVARAKRNLQRQLVNLNAQIAAAPTGSVEQQSLIAARGDLALSLSQATVLEDSARGNLTLLAEANAPSQPVAPKPLRNAILAALLALFAVAGLVFLLDALRRRVRSASDLLDLGFPVIGELPRLRKTGRSQIPALARSGSLYEPIGFVRVNLAMATPKTPSVIAFSSARPGEGKSTLVTATAAASAANGQRVLVIDLDLHRHIQGEFWDVSGRPWVGLPGAVEAAPSNILHAIENPTQASVLDVENGIHFLPAGAAARRGVSLLSTPEFPVLLHQWAQAYDIVLIDTPPLLALADALVIAKHTDGMVLVVESGETSVPELERVQRDVRNSGVKVIGAILNKVSRSQQGYYYSNYAQTS